MWILFAALRVPFVSSGVDVVGANFRTSRFIRSRLLAVRIRSASIVLRTYCVPSGFGIIGRGPNVSLCRFGRIGSAVSVRSKKEGWDRNSLSFASPISDRRRQPFLGWSIHYCSDFVLSRSAFEAACTRRVPSGIEFVGARLWMHRFNGVILFAIAKYSSVGAQRFLLDVFHPEST